MKEGRYRSEFPADGNVLEEFELFLAYPVYTYTH